ncbi:MAG: PEP/pyruvate-binding domain-containing protein [Acidobacteriota bacterium]
MGLLSFGKGILFGKRWRPIEAHRDTRAHLTLNYLTFKDLITSNDEVLEIISDLEEKLQGETYFGMTYIRFRCVTAATHTYRMIANLNKLSGRRFQELPVTFSTVQKAIEEVLEKSRRRASPEGPWVLDLSEVDASMHDRVGGKSANLGEIRNRVKLPVPDGFAITTDAFRQFLEANQLTEEIRSRLVNVDLDDLDSLREASEAVKEQFQAGFVPPEVERAILAAYRRLCDTLGRSARVSVRSSAVGEDGDISFAGQYSSLLNVDRDHLLAAYKEVLAGLYTPRAIFYRSVHGIPDEDIPMGVACIAMVDAAASGVACSVNPNRPDSGTLVINGAWGLGVGTVGGSVSPDFWEVSKDADMPLVEARLGTKETSVEPLDEGGIGPVALAPAVGGAYCLTERQVRDLAYIVVAAEKHYGRPQEMEWALDKLGRFTILQCRPLRLSRFSEDSSRLPPAEIEGHRLLLTGASASNGVASGPVFRLNGIEDLAFVPDGSVVVARHSSPQIVKVMGRVAAIVTDVGATTGHMASLAREFGVPAVLDTREATTRLEAGQVVTVDASRGAVYDGRIESIVAEKPAQPKRSMKGTPVHQVLVEVCRHIVPLHLTDPRSPDFRQGACRTFHDMVRFVHEKAFEEMFRMSDRVSDADYRSVRLRERLPFELYLIDIGGGLNSPPGRSEISPGDLRSEPMRALLSGMSDPRLRWWEPKGISLAGFLSVATESLFTPTHDTAERRLGDKSYAIVAESYCNFSSRIGYHFTAVDAFCSDMLNRNYVSFRFKGGAADDLRRAKRCELIGEILRRLDFQIERGGDLINARLRKFPKETILDRLGQLGRLVVATRQLDMRMGPSAAVGWYADAFFEGNFLFEPQSPPRTAPETAP